MSRLHDRAERWRRIVAARARGDSIPPEDQAYRAAYEVARPRETEHEVGLWSAVGSLADSPWPGEKSDDELVAGALAGLDLPTPLREPVEEAPATRHRRGPVVAAAMAMTLAAAAAAAAAVLWLVGARALRPDTEAGPDHSLSSAMAEATDGGEARTRTEPPARARRRRAPDTETPSAGLDPGCEDLGRGLRACLRGEGEVLAGHHPTIELRRGRVQVWAEDGSEVAPVTVTTEVAVLASRVASFEATLSEDLRCSWCSCTGAA